MRFTVRFLGIDLLDLYLGPERDDDEARDLSGGTTSAYPVGFTARWELPDGAERPEWE